jgi:hypothetical protein
MAGPIAGSTNGSVTVAGNASFGREVNPSPPRVRPLWRGKRTSAGKESLQAKLQTNHAAQHGMGHNEAGSSKQKCRTRAQA